MPELSLTWDDHHNTLVGVFEKLLETSTLVDCTLAAEGRYLKAHKIILSACSPYFELLFKQEQDKNPIVVLKDIKFQELKAMIDFIYRGKVKVPEERLGDFVDAAESLQIKGLGGDGYGSPKPPENEVPFNRRKEARLSLLPRKRRRRSYGSDDDNNGTSSSISEPEFKNPIAAGPSCIRRASINPNNQRPAVCATEKTVLGSSNVQGERTMDASELVSLPKTSLSSAEDIRPHQTIVKSEPEPTAEEFLPDIDYVETKEEDFIESALDSEGDAPNTGTREELAATQFSDFPVSLSSASGRADNLFIPPDVAENSSTLELDGSDGEDPASVCQSNLLFATDSESVSNEKARCMDETGEEIHEVDAMKSKKKLKTEHLEGEEYVNSEREIVPAKVPEVELCRCKNKCHLKINAEQQRKLFKDFYDLTNFDLQASYLYSLIQVTCTSKPCSKFMNSIKRVKVDKKIFYYFLLNAEGLKIPVCKTFFKNTFAVSDERISNLLRNKI